MDMFRMVPLHRRYSLCCLLLLFRTIIIKNKMKHALNHLHLSGICISLLLCGCYKQQVDVTVSFSDLPVVNALVELDSIIEIKNWLAIGPFEFSSLFTDPAETFSRNDLKRYGIKEGSISNASIEELQRRGASVFLIDAPSPQIKLLRYVSGKVEKKSNFYLVSRIHSSKTQDATLITDGSNSYAVWLNGEKQIEIRGKYNTNKTGDRFVNISLREGENMLFIKVNRGSNMRSWDLICAIASRREAERIYRVNYAGDFVVNPVVDGSFEVYAGPYLDGKVEMMDEKGKIVADGSFQNRNTNDKSFIISGLRKLAEGFYKIILTVGDEKIEEMVYKGDYSRLVKKNESEYR